MRVLWMSALLLLPSSSGYAQPGPTIAVDCSRGQSLQAAVTFSLSGTTIVVKGTCNGPITIATNGLRLDGRGTGVINGAGKDAITINGAQRVTLTSLTVTGGANGVVAENGAQVKLQNDSVKQNAVTGIVALGNSSITVSGGGVLQNGVHGLDIEATSSLIVAGTYTSAGNGVFGIDVNNGSSISLTGANLAVNGNTLGMQLGTNASGFLDGSSTLNTSNNFSDGLTVVSGSHVVDFGGTIVSSGNAVHGISINSRAALDLDAGSQVQASNNGQDGVHLEQLSVMTAFNNPQFSGVPATTTLTSQGNAGNGLNLLTNSEVLVDNYAAFQISANTLAGVSLDDGSSLSFGQTIPVSGVQSSIIGNHPDLRFTFASRLTTIANDTIGTVTCDATVLVRGSLPITCPH